MSDINANFIASCRNGHLEAVKCLLSSRVLKRHADIHAEDNIGFRYACYNGHLEVVKYFLYDLNIDISEKLDSELKKSCLKKDI